MNSQNTQAFSNYYDFPEFFHACFCRFFFQAHSDAYYYNFFLYPEPLLGKSRINWNYVFHISNADIHSNRVRCSRFHKCALKIREIWVVHSNDVIVHFPSATERMREANCAHAYINETWEFSVKNEPSHLLFNLYLARFSRLSTENNTLPVSTQVPFWFKWQIRRSGVLIKAYNRHGVLLFVYASACNSYIS